MTLLSGKCIMFYRWFICFMPNEKNTLAFVTIGQYNKFRLKKKLVKINVHGH